MGYVAFRLLPVVVGYGEFSGASPSDIAQWFTDGSSGVAYFLFWLGCAGALYLFGLEGKIQLYVSSLLFGVAYSVFEFPFGLIAKWNPDYDWVGVVIPYAISLFVCFTYLAIRRHFERSKVI